MLEIKHLRKSFGPLVAVDDVSFALERGQLLGLLGPNGAGKTTTVSMIAGLVTPDRGEVLINGQRLAGDTDPAKRRLGMVPQDLALYEELTAHDNLRFFGALYGLSGRALDAAMAAALELVELGVLFDPSRSTEVAMVRGILTEHVMQAVSREMFGGTRGRQLIDRTLADLDATGLPEDRRRLLRQMLESVQSFYRQSDQSPAGAGAQGGLTIPYTVREQEVTARSNVAYNGYAHSFAGMGIQFLLFAMANLGIEVLLERQRGLWKRIRSAPISRLSLLAGKTASGTIISLLTLFVSFAFAMIVFGVRIHGSVAGFFAVSLACALMAATFGLLVAAVGRTPASARGVTTLAVLMMVMLGGAWVPTFIFPVWLQQAALVVPARWAVDGLDAMTWRGIGWSGAIGPTLTLLGFAALFGAIAAMRFRWEES